MHRLILIFKICNQQTVLVLCENVSMTMIQVTMYICRYVIFDDDNILNYNNNNNKMT